MILGPVSSAAHSEPTISGALFPIGVGVAILVHSWFRFFRRDDDKASPSLERMIEISVASCIMIGLGIWEWIRSLRISN
jgi:hypothetical protein